MTNVPGQTDCHYCDVYQGEGGDWRGQVASAALSQDWLVITMVITPHYPRLIDGGWENVYLAQVCPRVPLPSSGLQSTLLTVGNFTLGPQPAPAASHQPPHDTSTAFCYLGLATELGTSNRYSSSAVYRIVLGRFRRYSVDICLHPAVFYLHPYLLAWDT